MATTMAKDSNHGWSVHQFEENRPELVHFIKQHISPLIDEDQCSIILIQAPVKSGKREMVEYIAKRDESFNPTRVHLFLTAFHRTADETQRQELGKHNLKIFSLKSRKEIQKCITWIKDKIKQNKHIVIHIDECDFGSGSRQMLSNVYKEIRNEPLCNSILYSATPQEVLFSGEVENEDAGYQEMMDDTNHTGECVRYIPPASFCGPAQFLDAGLVTDAIPFFVSKSRDSLCLTTQGKNIMEQIHHNIANRKMKEPVRNILFLRLSYSTTHTGKNKNKENKAIYQFIQYCQTVPELQECSIFVDKNDHEIQNINNENIIVQKILWSSKMFWKALSSERPIIVIADQTCSRSTELACHDRLYAIHDYRNKVTFSTSSQALERVNHYSGKYGGFQPIRIFGHKKTIELSAGRINYQEYLSGPSWKKKKIDCRKIKDKELYVIRSTRNHNVIHPIYNLPMSSNECDAILQELGCFVELSVSPRVEGRIYEKKDYKARFIPCNKGTFEETIKRDLMIQTKFKDHRFQNPFHESEKKGMENGQYKGYLREWKVFDFDNNIVTQCGWGVKDTNVRLTICYKDGELGVALRYYTGKTQVISTLVTTKKSMYVT